MQGVGNTIKIAFFSLYCKATPFKIPSRGVILLLTQLPLFITPHFSSLCEERKVRKLEESLHCVCVSHKEDVASSMSVEGAQSELGSISANAIQTFSLYSLVECCSNILYNPYVSLPSYAQEMEYLSACVFACLALVYAHKGKNVEQWSENRSKTK